jgi:hypothetical protein
VIALAGNRDIYYRANVYENDGVSKSPNHEGTHWVRIEQPKDSKIIFKQVVKNIQIPFIFTLVVVFLFRVNNKLKCGKTCPRFRYVLLRPLRPELEGQDVEESSREDIF